MKRPDSGGCLSSQVTALSTRDSSSSSEQGIVLFDFLHTTVLPLSRRARRARTQMTDMENDFQVSVEFRVLLLSAFAGIRFLYYTAGM